MGVWRGVPGPPWLMGGREGGGGWRDDLTRTVCLGWPAPLRLPFRAVALCSSFAFRCASKKSKGLKMRTRKHGAFETPRKTKWGVLASKWKARTLHILTPVVGLGGVFARAYHKLALA